ncbi:MAG: stalk domain-containing protein [Clostridiales bacterium]|nr:stalk domain-containing protein [Clostridiales bacterium]
MSKLYSSERSGAPGRGLPAMIMMSCLLIVFIICAGILIAEELDTAQDPSSDAVLLHTDETRARKPLSETGWECGEPNRSCSHILMNNTEPLLCVPSESIDDCLMIPLEHFRLIAGCGLEIGLDGTRQLIKYDRVYQIDLDSGRLVCGGESWVFPLTPFELHGHIYVPLRFLCEILGLEIRWNNDSDTVLLSSPWVDPGSLIQPMNSINKRILARLSAEEAEIAEAPAEPLELIVTFYYSSRNTTYTASGYQAVAGSIAADSSIPFGTQYYIPELNMICEDGVFTVQDRGRLIHGNAIDIFVPNALLNDKDVSAALRRGRFSVMAYPVQPGSR